MLDNVFKHRAIFLLGEFGDKKRHHKHGFFPLGVELELFGHVVRMRTHEVEGGYLRVFLGKKRHHSSFRTGDTSNGGTG